MVLRIQRYTLFPYTTLFRSAQVYSSALHGQSKERSALAEKIMPFTARVAVVKCRGGERHNLDRKSTRLNSSHITISYAVFCLKKKIQKNNTTLTQDNTFIWI